MRSLYAIYGNVISIVLFYHHFSGNSSSNNNNVALAFTAPQYLQHHYRSSSSSSLLNAITGNDDESDDSNNTKDDNDKDNSVVDNESITTTTSSTTFSLESYQRNRAMETFDALDATRFHFQILFVDTNNSMGRIAEGLLGRIAEYNDAMFVLFPSSATLNGYGDATPSEETNRMCSELNLCPIRSTDLGTSFSIDDLDEYDLVIVINDDIRSFILRSIDDDKDQRYYSSKVRLLSDFLNTDNNNVLSPIMEENEDKLVLDNILEYDLLERIKPYQDYINNNNAMTMMMSDDIFASSDNDNDNDDDELSVTSLLLQSSSSFSSKLKEAALIVATAGVAQFCLSTMDIQMDQAFSRLLQDNAKFFFENKKEWDDIDDQIRRCSSHISGYFSPQQRKEKYDKFCKNYQEKN